MWTFVSKIFNMYTLTLNGNSSELSCDIFPPLEVERNSQILCLLSLQTNNSIPNIEPECNTIGFRNFFNQIENIILPTGSYEINSIEAVIKNLLPTYVTWFQLNANINTLKCVMSYSHEVDF